MGKRSDFERVEKDFYPTIDPKAGRILQAYMYHPKLKKYYEPCAGSGHLIEQLDKLDCRGFSDILDDGVDALTLTPDNLGDADWIITNPPWSRDLLHPMITHFRKLRPTWLLFDADWAHTKQATPFLDYCGCILSVGRLKWIPDTKMTGKDNVAWYFFGQRKTKTRFINGNSLV